MSTIINTGITSPVTITTGGAYTSPLTITTFGSVETSGTAVYSSISQPTLVNDGTINSANALGVDLTDGGSVANTGTAALISGSSGGIYIGGAAGTVSNAGTITATGRGIALLDGGSIANSGTASLISGGDIGIYIGNAAR